MNDNKTLTTNGLTTTNIIFIALCIAMIASSAYLMQHFFETYFPKGLGATNSLCDINAFWGCDKATKSIFGKVFGVPTAFFGVVIGVIGLIGAIFPSKEMEQNNKAFFFLNAIGCLVLLLFSLFVLKGLCPFCTVYYVLSFAAAFLFWKYSSVPLKLNWKLSALYSFILIIPALFINNHFDKSMKMQESLSSQYIEQYNSLPDKGVPTYLSPFDLYKSSDNFTDAPIQIAIFSDFQCPFCKVLAEQMHKVIKRYEGKINIKYYFFPLDMECNKNVKRPFHQYACRMAKLAACDQSRFVEIHDKIFERQSKSQIASINQWEKDFGLEDKCYDDEKVKDLIVQSINTGDQYSVRTTPTIIINGKKIEGSLPNIYLFAILDSILESK